VFFFKLGSSEPWFPAKVSGVPRSADENLGILYEVLIIVPTCFYNNIKLWKFVEIERQSKRCRDQHRCRKRQSQWQKQEEVKYWQIMITTLRS